MASIFDEMIRKSNAYGSNIEKKAAKYQSMSDLARKAWKKISQARPGLMAREFKRNISGQNLALAQDNLTKSQAEFAAALNRTKAAKTSKAAIARKKRAQGFFGGSGDVSRASASGKQQEVLNRLSREKLLAEKTVEKVLQNTKRDRVIVGAAGAGTVGVGALGVRNIMRKRQNKAAQSFEQAGMMKTAALEILSDIEIIEKVAIQELIELGYLN